MADAFAAGDAFGVGLGVGADFDPGSVDNVVVVPALLPRLVFDEVVPLEANRFAFRFAGGLFSALVEFEFCLLALGFRLADSELERGRVASRPAFDPA